jgi:hypothetical protein
MTQMHFQCPCCGYMTLDERGMFDICVVCFWEDDDPEEQFGQPALERPEGPNHSISGRHAAISKIMGHLMIDARSSCGPHCPKRIHSSEPIGWRGIFSVDE